MRGKNQLASLLRSNGHADCQVVRRQRQWMEGAGICDPACVFPPALQTSASSSIKPPAGRTGSANLTAPPRPPSRGPAATEASVFPPRIRRVLVPGRPLTLPPGRQRNFCLTPAEVFDLKHLRSHRAELSQFHHLHRYCRIGHCSFREKRQRVTTIRAFRFPFCLIRKNSRLALAGCSRTHPWEAGWPRVLIASVP